MRIANTEVLLTPGRVTEKIICSLCEILNQLERCVDVVMTQRW